MTSYYTYYTSYPSNWSMRCIVEWLRIPQPISIEESENVSSKPESEESENVSSKPKSDE